jgi:hypothetical protein
MNTERSGVNRLTQCRASGPYLKVAVAAFATDPRIAAFERDSHQRWARPIEASTRSMLTICFSKLFLPACE